MIPIVVLSDCHLGAGPSSGEHDHFDQDAALAELLDADGGVEGPVEFVIAGDFLDTIQIRVQGTLPDRVYEGDAIRKVRRAVDGHPIVFDAFARLLGRLGRRLTFLVGNHDPALAFPGVQALLRERVGAHVGFCEHRVERSDLHVMHGNQWDGANTFEGGRILRQDASGTYASFPWGSYLVVDFVNRVRGRVPEIERIKPLGSYLRWAMRHRPLDAVLIAIEFLRFTARMRWHPRVDQRVTFSRLRRILADTCYSCDLVAQASTYLAETDARVVVAGHTHRALRIEVRPGVWYLNSGSWNPVISPGPDGRFRSVLHRTFVRWWPDAQPELLEWVPGEGATVFEPTFGHVHLHANA